MFMPGNKGWHLFIWDIEGNKKLGKAGIDVWVTFSKIHSYLNERLKI